MIFFSIFPTQECLDFVPYYLFNQIIGNIEQNLRPFYNVLLKDLPYLCAVI
jgi:hypothetical protein